MNTNLNNDYNVAPPATHNVPATLADTEHFSMQGLADMLGQNMALVNAMATVVGGMSDRFDKIDSDYRSIETSVQSMEVSMSAVQKDIKDIKENEEITYSQQENMREAVDRRVLQLLEIPLKSADRTYEDRMRLRKYSKRFHARCWVESSWKGHLRRPYRQTPKKYYDDAIRDIEAWIPKNGTDALIDEVDRDAKINREAKASGY